MLSLLEYRSSENDFPNLNETCLRVDTFLMYSQLDAVYLILIEAKVPLFLHIFNVINWARPLSYISFVFFSTDVMFFPLLVENSRFPVCARIDVESEKFSRAFGYRDISFLDLFSDIDFI